METGKRYMVGRNVYVGARETAVQVISRAAARWAGTRASHGGVARTY